jgi:telomerase reverse transcriptase
LSHSNEVVMTRKRKRSRQEQSTVNGTKRLRPCGAEPIDDGLVKQALLSQYYPKVLTLRKYLLLKLPASSNVRRKKISAVKRRVQSDRVDEIERDDSNLAEYLDQTLVGVQEEESLKDERWKQWTCFSQRPDNSESTVRSGDGDGDCSQSEVRYCLLFAPKECRCSPANKR